MALSSNRWGLVLVGCLVLAMSACGSKSSSDDVSGGGSGTGGSGGSGGNGGTGGGNSQTGRTFLIKPNANATRDMVDAMVQAAPGDVIQFDEGYFDLKQTLMLSHTESVTIKGRGKDKTILSFRNSPDGAQGEGILADTVGGLVVQDLTVVDTSANAFELRNVNHGTLRRVRALWSSNGGRQSPDPITAENFATRLNVPCTDPATLHPDAPENQFPGADTSSPDYTVSPKSGRYGIYPVASENILIEESESVGASDAGIYVGQTNTAIIKNSRAAFNVFGFEIENVRGGEYQNNIAECNTGGFLVYDLDNLRQYGDRSRMYGNIARNNNTYNFADRGFVGSVPAGSGMITLAYDRIDIFENTFENNNTGGIIHASYELFPEGAGRPSENFIDWYTEGVHIFKNTFRNNGNGLPLATTDDLQNGETARILPALVGLKNQAACLDPRNAQVCGTATAGLITSACGGASTLGDALNCAKSSLGFRGAHIVWDGLLDKYNPDCPYPKAKGGGDAPKDERGKPIYSNADAPDPGCHYNGYKFDATKADKPRKVPDWWASCIDDDNDFSGDSIAFANFKGLKGLEPVIAAALASPDEAGLTKVLTSIPTTDLQNFASSYDLTPHRCVSTYGRNLPLLPPVVIPPYVPTGEYDPQPSEEVVAQICGAAVPAGQINTAAATVNCPTLDQYHLFSNPEDPTSAPNGRSVPFSLTSKLFSDYAVKYRVLFLPPKDPNSAANDAIYHDAATGDENTTIVFPVGTIIAKTFAFADEDSNVVRPAETRLLIKRRSSKGTERWDGLPYVWGTENGKRVARLAMGGRTLATSWNFHDVDSGQLHEDSTSNYSVPNTNQCLSCHANKNAESGSAPIGPKVRFLNKAYASETSLASQQSTHAVAGKNQIEFWCSTGLMSGCPKDASGNLDLGVDPSTKIATKLERVPTFNKPGDSGFPANSPEDIEKRARAWLEVNCQHCHNARGFASNTGLDLDSFGPVDQKHGICKTPTATGNEGRGGRRVDIHPANVADSILAFRIGPDATTPAARMPPLARSKVDTEAYALIQNWIQNVIVKDEAKYPNSTKCPN